MGLFNNLRHHIVEKLIRPGDGYTYTGTWDGGPVQFVRDEGNYYYSRMLDSQRTYYKPTLTGWKETDNVHGAETTFNSWLVGILDNIYSQYSEKLSSISRKELKEFQGNENSEPLTINKQYFCDIMVALDKYLDSLDTLEDILNVVFGHNILTEIFDKVVDTLEEDFEPDREFGEPSMIKRWLFEFDAGRTERAQEGLDGYPLTTAEELYDYLMWKRDGKQHED